MYVWLGEKASALPPTVVRWVAYILFVLITGADAYCGEASKTPSGNVVVILIDTLRADHLPFYGYAKNTAPFLDSLAKKSVVFDRAYSACSSTAPAVASIFTSLYPSQHGVITGFVATTSLKRHHANLTLNRIPAELTTLVEEFKRSGYKTFGVADNINISDEMGFLQGFDKFKTHRYKGAPTINVQVKEWKNEIVSSSPYLLYIHYMDPHKPHYERAPWFTEAHEPKDKTINAYDSEITFTDEHIKELFTLFGWEKDTLVVVLADHGEEFWDHGDEGHGKSLYSEVTRVPFFIYHPSFAPRRVTQAVSTIDLLPTLAVLKGFTQNESWQGKSLAPLIHGDLSAVSHPILSQLLRRPEHPRATLRSIVVDNWHLISSVSKTGEIATELYDLGSDPVEKINRAPEARERAEILISKLKSVEEGLAGLKKSEVQVELDRESLDQLRSLGYID